jgi:hypothetical protein
LKAELSAVKTSTALSLLAVAAQSVVRAAVDEGHKDTSLVATLKPMAESAARLIGKLHEPAAQAFKCLSELSPQAAGAARAALQSSSALSASALADAAGMA